MKSLASAGPADPALSVLSHFRVEFYDCLYSPGDALFELTDAVLCADGPVTSLTAEHRRGHGVMYDAVNHGWLEPRRLLASTPLLRAADGRIVLAVDVSNWLRPDAPTSPDLLFCHVYTRGRSADQFIPGLPYSFVAALETGRTSWTALLDAIRLGPADDATAVTAAQLREVVTRLVRAGQWRPGDADILNVRREESTSKPRHQGGTAMNHAEWKTRRNRALLGEGVEDNPEYDRLYEEVELAHDLGQLVHDRRTALGLSQAELAERCGMQQPQISRIEGGDTVPTIPLLRRLARAMDADLTIELTPHHEAA